MKKLIAVVCTALAMSLSAPAVFAQAPAPAADPAALAAVNELFEAMKYREMMTGMFAQMQQSLGPMMEQGAHAAIDGNKGLSAAQKKAAKAKASADLPAFVNRFTSMMNDPKFMDELFAEIAPLYARHFSAAEINQIAAFYKTPVGAKMISTMPALMNESMQISQRVVMPRVQAMVLELSQAQGQKP